MNASPIYLDYNATTPLDADVAEAMRIPGGLPVPAVMTVEDAQAKLKELIEKLAPGEEIVITENQQPVARLVGEAPARPSRPSPGLGKGSILYMAPDFDEPLEEFKEYME